MRTHPLHPTRVLLIACALAVLLFLLAIVMPQASLWGLFFLPIVFVFLWGRRRDIYLVAVLCGALVLGGYGFKSPHTVDDLLLAHLLPIAILWAGAWLLDQRRDLQEQMVRNEQELGEQVATRTGELAASEERYRALFDHAGDGIFSVDAGGRYLDVNDHYCRMLGRPRAEIVGAHVSEMTEGVTEEFFAAVGEELAQHGSATFERRLRHRNGTFPEVEVTAAPLRGGRMAIVRDITERKAAERERQFLSALVASAPDAVVGRMIDGTILSWNRGAEQLFGYTAEEAIGQNLTMLDASDSHARLADVMTEVAQGSAVEGVETQRMAKDGRIFECEISSFPVWDTAGVLIGAASFTRDITARKATERALRAAEQHSRRLFHSSPVGITLTRLADGLYKEVNDAFLSLTGYSREELIGHTSLELGIISPEDRTRLAVALQEEGSLHGTDLVLHTKGGEQVYTLFSIELMDLGGEPCVLSSVVDITARKRLEAELHALVERWNIAAEMSSIAVWDWHAGSDQVVWDERMCLLHGLAPGTAMTFAAWRALIHPDDRAAVEANSRKSGLERTRIPVEYRVVLPDGSLRYLLSIGGGLYDESGTPVRQLGIIMDISERKRAEHALRESQARYQMLADHATDVIWSMDPAGKVTYVSPSVLRQSGYTPEEAMSHTLEQTIAPGSRAAVRAAVGEIYRLIQAGQPVPATPNVFEMLRKDGTTYWGENIYSAVYNAQGEFQQLVGATREVTRRVHAEVELREAYQRVRLAADAASIGIWNWNLAGSSLEWDDRMCELYAVTADERAAGVTYALWRSRIHPDDLGWADPIQGDFSRAGSHWSGTYRIVLPGGAIRYIQASSVTQYTPDGAPRRIIGINRDLTDQKQYEQLLQDTNAVLEQRVVERNAELRSALTNLQRANRLKDEFMAMISHELRTPLTGVLSMSEMLEEQIAGPLNDRQVTYVKGIGASGERLLAVINGILGYTHLLSGKVELHAEPCRLAYLLGSCAAAQRPKAAQKNQSLAVQVAPPDLTIISDATALAEVLKLLLDNALKFTPEGGQIGLAAQPAPGASDGVAHGSVDLVVWDTGIGIAADQFNNIFHAFTQADSRLSRSHEGIGIGLAYVDLMVHLLGGTIAVESELGRGSRFTITLPTAAATPS